jgi:RNA polymerase sigma-70 factor (ECF subfamily)
VLTVVSGHLDPMPRGCYCHLLDWDIVQEEAQDVFIAAFERLPHLRDHASIKAWLYGIATNKCREMRRNRTRRETLRHDYQALIGQYAYCNPPSPPDELCSREHQCLQVWQALQRLRIYDRELVVLRSLEELLYDEIASILKVSRKTVERHLPRALAKFLRAYERCQCHAIQ